MQFHKSHTHRGVQLWVAGVVGWMLMGCSSMLEETVAQMSQADTSGCMSNADCPSGDFCDFSQVIDPSAGGQCSADGGGVWAGYWGEWCEPDCKTLEMGAATSAGGGGGSLCVSCVCTSEAGSWEGSVCGTSTEFLVEDCWGMC